VHLLVFIYYFSDLPENTILFISYSILFFSTFLSAVFTTVKIKSKGFYYGIIIGVSCFGIICIVSNIFSDFNIFSVKSTSKLILSIMAGAGGGALGVNLTS